jgi:hypothetical protein
MAGAVEVRGGRNLTRIARDLAEVGNKGLKNELLRGIRAATKTAIPDVRTAAEVKLPKRGGLAERVAGQKFGTRTSLRAKTASVRITGQGMKELRDIDQGRLRKPLFGNRDHWYGQAVDPGFFSATLEKKGPEVRRQIEQVMRAVKIKIEKGV